VIVLTAMTFHWVTAVASAVAGGAADAPTTPSPDSTRTATPASQVNRVPAIFFLSPPGSYP